VVGGCDDDRLEARRLSSPDARADAVVVDVSGGATEPYVFEVYLVPKSGPLPRPGDAVVRLVGMSTPGALKVEWKRAGLLTISYDYAWVRRYTNLWTVQDGRDGRYVVEVRLIPPPGDDSALPIRYRF
jgi:hypothetical protein